MICSHCGQQNPDSYLYCASCGARLTSPSQATQPPGVAGGKPTAAGPLRIQPVDRQEPRTEHAPRDLRYLLEDDEPQKSRVAPVIVVLSLLALVAFGWFELRPLLQSEGTKSSTTTTTAPAEIGSRSSTETAPPTKAPAPAPVEQAPTSSQTAPPTQGADEAATASNPDAVKPAANPVPPPPTIDETQRRGPRKGAPVLDASVETPARPRPTPKATVKPAPRAAPPDPIKQAEAYLYGRGVPQDCERAVSMLKSEADRSNPRARSTLGSMYATGHCVSRDLPTAYRYFALVLRTDPENAAASQNLESLWKQMTPPERQAAIKQ